MTISAMLFGFVGNAFAVGYFKDTETSNGNTMTAGTLDFSLSSATGFSPNVTPTQTSDRAISIIQAGSLDFNYTVQSNTVVGDLCTYLTLSASLGGVNKYTGTISGFNYNAGQFSTAGGNWQFTANLTSSDGSLQNKTCSFNLIFNGTQIGGVGFNSSKTISNTITSGSWVVSMNTWTQTTQTDFNAGLKTNIDVNSLPNSVKLAGKTYIYAFKGNDATTFWRYDVVANIWELMANAPDKVKEGGALTYDGTHIYALGGSDTKNFWRYNITTNVWSSMKDVPDNVKAGGSLIYNGTYIYALRGDDQKHFWRYNIVSNTWLSMKDTPDKVKEGGALTYDGTYIYALGGSETKNFWRYDITANTWVSRANTAVNVGTGGALVFDGTYIYALGGSDTKNFWRFNILSNTWSSMTDSLDKVKEGGALTYDGTYIYTIGGKNSTNFWRYNIATNGWLPMTDTPGTVVWGGSLINVFIYSSSGTLESQSFNSGAMAEWQSLEWDETVPTGTDITLEVSTSNDGSAWSAWQLSSSASPISLVSLPETRYIKWKATLTTTDIAQTPVLSEVRVKYYSGAASQHIALNEFLPNPSGTNPDYGFDFGEDNDLMPKGEWVEIYNKAGGRAVDLSGWYIKDQEGNVINITNSNTNTGSTIIGSGSWVVVYMNQEILNNDGDTVYLYDIFGTAIDSYSYTGTGDVPGNKSYARIPDGIGAWYDPIPTPGLQNIAEVVEVVEQEPIIEENASVEMASSADSTIEIQPTITPTDLVIEEKITTLETIIPVTEEIVVEPVLEEQVAQENIAPITEEPIVEEIIVPTEIIESTEPTLTETI